MSLLDLPPEILVLILQNLEPDSFALTLQTCKAVRYHAIKSKQLLLLHLQHVPGLPYELNDLSSEKLLSLFSHRASKHVRDGAHRMADIAVYISPLKVWGRAPTRSCFIRYVDQGLSSRPLLTFAVDTADASINIFDLHKSIPRLKLTVSPDALDLDDSAGEGTTLSFEVLNIAFPPDTAKGDGSRADIAVHHRMAVLYRYRVKRRSKDRNNSFINSAVAQSEVLCKLAIWDLNLLDGPRVESVSDIAYEAGPLDLQAGPIAMSSEGYVVIVFTSALHDCFFEVRSYAPKELSKRIMSRMGKSR